MSIFTGNNFFHDHIQRFIVAFGESFSDIQIVRRDATGAIIKKYNVPIEYAPRNKWFSRIKEQNDLTKQQVKVTLPRITFEIVDLKYAPDRRIGVPGTYILGNVPGKSGKIFSPVPYDVVVQLYVLTKDLGEAHQIIEQIAPFFQPYFTINYEILPEYQLKKDVHINLDGFRTEDTFEGSPEDVREVIQTFTLTAQLDFFGPTMASDGVIKDVIINMGYQFNSGFNSILDIKVDPITATKTDPHTVVETKTILA